MNYNPIKNLKRGGMLVVSSALFSLCLLSSCEDYTEIIPKGRNMLTKTTDLEYLLNHTYQPGSTDMIEIANNYIYSSTNVALELESDVKTRKQIRWSYDEASMDKLAELTASDEDYDECYEIIGTVANPILMQLPTASGPEEKKNQLKCEALTLRAYFHYLAVQKFAAAYNPATAAETRAIAYLKEDADILKETEQVTLKEVYDNILADLDEAISLDALPQTAPMMRMNKACPYAVKALVCMAMQDNDKAEEAAKQALAINGTVNNYFESLVPFVSKSETVYQLLSLSRYGIDEDYFYTWGVIYAANIPPSNWDFFEKGHIWHDKSKTDWVRNDYKEGSSNAGLGWYSISDQDGGYNDHGLRTVDMYLTVAECEIDKGNFDAAMEALDKIRVNRIDPEVYAPLMGTVKNKKDAIYHFKQTEYGEHFYTYQGFICKKRWTQKTDYAETYSRTINGKTYSIAPTSKMWIFPFPLNVMSINSKFKQNYK